MRNEIFVNVGPCETRVAVREADQITELHIERPNERGVGGGIYRGRVSRVLPGMQAAFVDIGLERAGFLYVADYRAELSDVDMDTDEGGGRRRAGAAQRGAGAQIQDLLEEGNEILVQVSKEPLGTKGARITSRISLPGRHLVLMPWVSRVGVSRRIGGDRERRRLRSIVEKHRPEGLGFIVRTVSHGVSEADIKADIEYLTESWKSVQARCEEVTEVPALVYQEPPLHLRILRDLVTHETKQLVIDDVQAYGEMQDFVQRFMASPRPRMSHYKGAEDLFDSQRIEGAIEAGLSRKAFLKSGGHLVIDQSEALTAIDVNTGRFTGGKGRNLEETILKTNLEAVREIARQLRFRNIGGLIILDMIDMEILSNREKVYRGLLDALREDKSKVNLLKISELGLIEMTRKRTRENLVQQLCDPCPDCEGRGYTQSARTVCNKMLRELPKAAEYLSGGLLVLHAHPDVASILLEEEADTLKAVSEKIERQLEVRPDPAFHREQFEISSIRIDGQAVVRKPVAVEPEIQEVEAVEPEAVEAQAAEPAEATEPGDATEPMASAEPAEAEADATVEPADPTASVEVAASTPAEPEEEVKEEPEEADLNAPEPRAFESLEPVPPSEPAPDSDPVTASHETEEVETKPATGTGEF